VTEAERGAGGDKGDRGALAAAMSLVSSRLSLSALSLFSAAAVTGINRCALRRKGSPALVLDTMPPRVLTVERSGKRSGLGIRMQNRWWNVLIVDDERDVLAITKLALKRLSVYGLPLVVHEATSKADAIQWFRSNPEAKALSVAMIDVVMEGDEAGLELCEYIREQAGNALTRIVLRTGQAGKAPERRVADKYDISLYLPKVEATEDKLYSVVKCCIQDWYSTTSIAQGGTSLAFLAPHTASVDMFNKRLGALFFNSSHDTEGRTIPSYQPNFCCIWGDDDDLVGSGVFEDRRLALETRDRLLKLPFTRLNELGDIVFSSPQPLPGQAAGSSLTTVLFVSPRSPDGWLPQMQFMLCTATWPIPDFALGSMHAMFMSIRPLYRLAQLSGTPSKQ
jgi:CheY-like chemotaxis protein